MAFPGTNRYIIIGAGIHGLSTAYHLAKLLKSRNLGSGSDILVVDKGGIAAGASGIACGVIRNNYFQPAMRELMAHSVKIWESDPNAYAYHPVGYIQLSPEIMHADIVSIYQQQKAIGYESILVEGSSDSFLYMKNIFNDWQAKGITSVLHEKRGGYANNAASIYGLATKAEAEGVRILTGVTVTGFQYDSSSNAVKAVMTNKGRIECEQVVIGTGPWIRDLWSMLGLPEAISIKTPNGEIHKDIPMWHFWQLEEGVLAVEPDFLKTNDGQMPPVMHVDSDAPLYSDVDGSLITEDMWGIYYKPDFNFGGIQGGASPYKIEKPVQEVAIDPYGPASPEFVSSDTFAHMWCSALAHCHRRFEGTMDRYKKESSGGLGCFTPDSFPVFDHFRDNVYIIADSNHGYKMIGVGELVAEELTGNKSSLLEPFRFSRYEKGELHPVSHSPFPWS